MKTLVLPDVEKTVDEQTISSVQEVIGTVLVPECGEGEWKRMLPLTGKIPHRIVHLPGGRVILMEPEVAEDQAHKLKISFSLLLASVQANISKCMWESHQLQIWEYRYLSWQVAMEQSDS